MIEQWFTKEVRQHLDEHHRLVITDTKNEGAFLLALLPPRMKITLITVYLINPLFQNTFVKRNLWQNIFILMSCQDPHPQPAHPRLPHTDLRIC